MGLQLGDQTVFLTIFLIVMSELTVAAAITTKPNCIDHCGHINIPYPFGMKSKECYLNDWFEVDCINGTKPRLKRIGMEVTGNFSLDFGTVQVKGPIFSSNCSDMVSGVAVNLSGSPFFFSPANRFTAIGCNNKALMTQVKPEIVGCMSSCANDSQENTTCYGQSCCQTTVPSLLQVLNVSFENINASYGGDKCKIAFLVDHKWVLRKKKKLVHMVKGMKDIRIRLDWRVYDKEVLRRLHKDEQKISCDVQFTDSTSSDGIVEQSTNYPNTTLCMCGFGYEGNPYLFDGCKDVDECEAYGGSCSKMTKCVNTPGSYKCEINTSLIVVIVVSAVVGILLFIGGAWCFYKLMKKRKNIRLKKKFFKRNGGLLLQQQLSSSDGSVQKTKIFSSKELEKATDRFNENRILGQGGQGTVYKGMLTDGSIVAVKRSIVVDEEKLEEFINEVVILTQISHRNVVKLLGCCLETEVPILVYEFIPNGNLFQYLQDHGEERLELSWKMRLQIGTEVAEALSYLHSAASIPIYHRDIKSTNILLDDKHKAKVSDFGTSRTITIEQTHLTTQVQGTYGYLDPEYFLSTRFTEKSDVYSFGVVLVELLTGKKPISLEELPENRILATRFVISMEENKLFDILDDQVKEHWHGGEGEVMVVANLAKSCLNLSGKERPTMKEVAMELQRVQLLRKGVKNIQEQNNDQETNENFMPKVLDLCNAFPISNTYDFENGHQDLAIDVKPLISYNTC